MKTVPFTQFIQATKEAVARVRDGNATQDDLAQIEYVRQGKTALQSQTGYPITDSWNNAILTQAAGLAEDRQNFTYYTPCSLWGRKGIKVAIETVFLSSFALVYFQNCYFHFLTTPLSREVYRALETCCLPGPGELAAIIASSLMLAPHAMRGRHEPPGSPVSFRSTVIVVGFR